MSFLKTTKRLLFGGTILILGLYFIIEMMSNPVSIQYVQSFGGNIRGVINYVETATVNRSGNGNQTILLSNVNPVAVPVIPARRKKKTYDLLINSYMNSGSRFTGSLFGFRKGSFYFYEPLWRFSVWDYYDAPNSVCKSTEGSTCRVGSAALVNQVKDRNKPVKVVSSIKPNSTITDMMLDILNDIYNCDFSRLENLVVPNVHDKVDLAGDSWAKYRDCIRMRVPKITCLQRQAELCKNSSHVVTKVLRLTTGSLDKLMEKRDNLKIIHLFRNPMAIVNSRTESNGYPVRDYNANAATLCKKMTADYIGAMELQKKYPDRVKMVFYEDIKSNVEKKIKKLYDFIGMDYNEMEVNRLNKVKANTAKKNTPQMLKTRVQDNAHWWRTHMSYSRYKGAHDRCHAVSQYFNLTFFTDTNHLMKLNIPEMKLPSHLIIHV